MSNEEEVWKVYPDYDFIEVSNLGRVRTKDRVVTYKNGRKHFIKEHILKQYRDHYGYMYVQFYENGKRVTLKAHRMVAITFIPNPDNLPQVNHIDCNRSNNVVSNLEWCTNQYNTAYREKYGKSSSRPVIAVNAKTGEVLHFKSRGEVERKLNIHHQDILPAIKGQNRTIHGYWLTEDESEITEEKIREIKANMRLSGNVISVNQETNDIFKFESQHEAAYQLGVSQTSVSNVVRGKLDQIKDCWFCHVDEDVVEKVRIKFGDEIAKKVEKLINENKKVQNSLTIFQGVLY